MTTRDINELNNLHDIYLSSKHYMSKYEYYRMRELENCKRGIK